jgi:hypothetical protein
MGAGNRGLGARSGNRTIREMHGSMTRRASPVVASEVSEDLKRWTRFPANHKQKKTTSTARHVQSPSVFSSNREESGGLRG